MRLVIPMMVFAATLVGCDGSDELSPEVAQRTTAIDDATSEVAVELGQYTATMILAADDLVTLHAEAASYSERAQGDINRLFIALTDVYECVADDGDTDALDAMSLAAMAMWQEVAYHRLWLPRIGEVSICKTEVRRHQAAMEVLIDRIFELEPALADAAVDYLCR